MKASNTALFLLALSLGSAQADLFGNRSRDRDERPRTSIKDGVKDLAKGIWRGVRYQKAAIEDTLDGVKNDIRRTVVGEDEEEPYYGPQPRRERRPAYNPGPYRRDDSEYIEDGGDFLRPEPLWKDHERELERRRQYEAERGYNDRRGKPLPPPRQLPEYDPRNQPRQVPQENLYGPLDSAVRTPAKRTTNPPRTDTSPRVREDAPATLPKPQETMRKREETPEFEQPEVKPLPPEKTAATKPKPESKPVPGVQSKPQEKPAPKEEAKPKTSATDFKKATKTKKPGIVLSPYPPYDLLDVTGLKSGSLAKDPKTGQIFRVP